MILCLHIICLSAAIAVPLPDADARQVSRAPAPWRSDQHQRRSVQRPPVVADSALLADVQRVIMAGAPGILPPDSPANRVDPNTPSSLFGGVCSLSISTPDVSGLCSGAAIDRVHILTAAHCVDLDDDGLVDPGLEITVFFNADGDQSLTILPADIASIDTHPDFTGFNNPTVNDDLAVITLTQPLPETIPVYPPFRSELVGGETVTLIGYGQSGFGTSGPTVAASFTVKRSGVNQADDYFINDEVGEELEVWAGDFDGPPTIVGCTGGDTLGNDRETSAAPGDSGGPVVVDVDGELQLWGVNTFVGNCTGAATMFDGRTGGMVVNAYLPFLDLFLVCAGNCGDCNDNGVFDGIDIAQGTSADANGNFIPDECQVLGAGDLWIATNIFLLKGYSNAFGSIINELPMDLNIVQSVRAGRDGLLYICGSDGFNHGVFRFNATTGAFVDQFIGGEDGSDWPADLAFGPDGLVYVLNRGGLVLGDASITRHHPATGALIDVFVADDPGTPELENGGITAAVEIAFGPLNRIHVTNSTIDSTGVFRFNGATGAFIDVFAQEHPGFAGNMSLAFHDGLMYVLNPSGAAVYRFDPNTGAFIDTFVSVQIPDVLLPRIFRFGPSGDMYLLSVSLTAKITRHDGRTGALQQLLLETSNSTQRFDVVPPAASPGDINGDGFVGVIDLLQLLASWGACDAVLPCPADLDGDGAVGITDMLQLLAIWDS